MCSRDEPYLSTGANQNASLVYIACDIWDATVPNRPAPRSGKVRIQLCVEDGEDVGLANDQPTRPVELHFGSGVFAEKDAIADSPDSRDMRASAGRARVDAGRTGLQSPLGALDLVGGSVSEDEELSRSDLLLVL